MSKWPMARLGDVCSFLNGGTPSKTEERYYSGTIPLITGADIVSNEVTSARSFITLEAVNNSATNLVKKGTVLLVSRTGVGKVAIAGMDLCFSQDITAILPEESRLDKKYLCYFLKSKASYFRYWQRGATIQGITRDVIESVKIPLFPLTSQKRVVEVLDKSQEIIECHKKQLEEFDNLIKATFYDMFGNPVKNEHGWEIKALKDVCNKITDGTHNSPSNNDMGKYMYITAKNIKRDGFDLSNLTYISEEDHKEIYSRCNPELGDVLYIKDGVTTGIAQVNTLLEEFSLLSSVALLKPRREIVNEYYLREVLNNEIMYANIRMNMGGAAITRLTIRKIELIRIPIPPMSTQRKFAKIVANIENQKSLARQSLAESQNLFNSLISRYFD
jgi:type I restriction enzyme S subunit